MSKIKLVVYRHKERKDIFLMRNWGYCGGGETTEFYKATKNMLEAISNTNIAHRMNDTFEHWFGSFLDENKKTKLVVKINDSKEFEFDGYKGTATKEIILRVSDFEKVELTEKGGEAE